MAAKDAWAPLTGKMSGGGLRSVAWARVITLNSISVITLLAVESTVKASREDAHRTEAIQKVDLP